MKQETGRSMIEMLGVLSVAGVLSIGGMWGYRRAMDKYQASTILEDVQGLSVTILERKNQLPDGNISTSSFTKQSQYEITATNNTSTKSFSVNVGDVPKGVCQEVLKLKTEKFALYAGPNLYNGDDSICAATNKLTFLYGNLRNLCDKLAENPADACVGGCACDGACLMDINTNKKVCCDNDTQTACRGNCYDACGGTKSLDKKTCLCNCPPIDNCTTGSYDNDCKCTSCEPGYKVSATGSCQKCSVSHCASATSYDSDCKCTSCQNGYTPNASGSCDACNVAHCADSYGNNCACKLCDEGYQVSGGSCVPCSDITGCTAFNSTCGCATCDAANGFVSDGQGGCQCDTGYSNNGSGVCCQMNVEFCSGYNADCQCTGCSTSPQHPYMFLSQNKGACCDPKSYCNTYDDSCKCTSCTEGYQPDSNGNCADCGITGCTRYKEGRVCECQTCDTGYELSGNTCTPVSNCPTITGCASYDEDCNCTACTGGPCPDCGSTIDTCSYGCLTGCTVSGGVLTQAQKDTLVEMAYNDCLNNVGGVWSNYCGYDPFVGYSEKITWTGFTCKNGTCSCTTFGSGTCNLSPAVGSSKVGSDLIDGGECVAYLSRSTSSYNVSNYPTACAVIPTCLIEGTLITLANGQCKAIEDVDYDDDLLVWDFDNACFASAKPLWIKVAEEADSYNVSCYDDGTMLKTVNNHRIFNKQAGRFTYTMKDETPLGTVTFNDKGKEPVLIQKYSVPQKVRYYNIITKRHLNCFANGILTSCRLNNLYAIRDMKFVKDDRKLLAYTDFPSVPREWVDGLRLLEQPTGINRGSDNYHGDNSVQDYALRLIALDKAHQSV